MVKVNRSTLMLLTPDGAIYRADDPNPSSKRCFCAAFRFRQLFAGKTVSAKGENVRWAMRFQDGMVYVIYAFANQSAALDRHNLRSLRAILAGNDLEYAD